MRMKALLQTAMRMVWPVLLLLHAFSRCMRAFVWGVTTLHPAIKPKCRHMSQDCSKRQGVQHPVIVAGAGTSGAGPGPGGCTDEYIQLFIMKYVCPREECHGTLAPVLGTEQSVCNLCGCVRTDAEFLAEMQSYG